MKASIVIPAYNAGSTLAACLAACCSQSRTPHEVIVVDDGSTDDTARIAAAFPVRYVYQKNAGPAAARNRGAAEATGDILVFTDADCVPEPDWIARLAGAFREHDTAVGGTYGIANPASWLARMIHEEIAVRHAGLNGEVDFLGSFNVAYRREAFEAAGGFDATFRQASAEDNDLAYRLHDRGGTMRFVPEARVAHYHPSRLWPYLRTQQRHGYWRVRLYTKHPHRARRGDRYAGLPDLLMPPCALALACMAPLAMLCPAAAWLWLPGCLVYFGLRARLPLALLRRTGDARMLAFGLVAALRDVARAAGMASGVWHFIIRRRDA